MKFLLQKSAWMIISLCMCFVACDDKESVRGFQSQPIIDVAVEQATVTVDSPNKTIAIEFYEVVDLSEVTVNFDLKEGTGMNDPATNPAVMDLTEPRTITITSDDGRKIPYIISAKIGDMAFVPFRNFTAQIGDFQADVEIFPGSESMTLTFENVFDMSAVDVDFDDAPHATLISPTGKTWDMTEPVEFKFNSSGEEVTYTVTASGVLRNVFPEFNASQGEETGVIVINDTDKTITVAINNDGNFEEVNIEYTLGQNVTLISAPSGDVWNLNEPKELKIDAGGQVVTYTVSAIRDVFEPVPESELPFGLERVYDGLPNNKLALYRLPEWNDEAVVAYVLVLNGERTGFSAIGNGYGSMMTMTQYKAQKPDATVIISAGDKPGLLYMNGVLKQKTENTANGDAVVAMDADGKFQVFTANHYQGGSPGAAETDKVFSFDSGAEINATYAIGTGGQHLNVSAAAQFPGGIIPTGIVGNYAQLAMAVETDGQNATRTYFFICQKGNGSAGMPIDDGLKVLIGMGARRGFPVAVVDNNSRDCFGLVVNGETLVQPEVAEAGSGYAVIIE